MTRTTLRRAAIAMLAAVAFTLAAAAQAPPVRRDSDEAVDAVPREQTIYIPYSKLRWVFEKKGRGVFLPYEEFEKLWRAARAARPPVVASRPPVGALITEADSEATVEQDAVRVSAKLTVEVLAEGWSEAPLRLSDAAIRSAKLDGQPARITLDEKTGYKLLVEKEGKEPRQFQLLLEYAKAFSTAPGQNSVTFQAPQAPVNRWRIRIPQPGVKVSIQPLLAAAEAPPTGGAGAESKETVVLAFVGAAPAVRFDWTPKAEGATGLAALATVESQQEITIDEGVMRTRTRLKYDISRAELPQLLIEAPADQKVTGVFDANVRQWEVKRDGELQKITVQLFQPAMGEQNIAVELEKFLADLAQQELAAPVVKAVDAGRQQGVVVVRLGGSLRAEPSRSSGLLQLDAAELPKPLADSQWALSYRFAALPFELALRIEKAAPQIRAAELVEAYLEPQQLTLDLLAVFHIERAGVFQLQLDIPAGYEIRQVTGHKTAGAEAAAVDSHHQQGPRLTVNLARKALGTVGLLVELQKNLNNPNLLSPTGKPSKIPLDPPRVAPETVERSTGGLIVYAPENLRVGATGLEGIRSVSSREALEGVESARGGRFPDLREVSAFAYSRQKASLSLDVERRKPYITVRQLLTARIEAGVVQYEAAFFYDIRYSGVESLRIDVPKELAKDIRNVTPGVSEKTIEPPNVADGCVAWSLTGKTEFLGSAAIRFAWERKMDELEVGKSIKLQLPRLQPREVDRAWGQIAIAKAESLDVNASGQPRGLRPIDPQQDLMPDAKVRDAAGAFEFLDDWALTVAVTRYKLEEVKHTSIERAVLRMVVVRRTQGSPQKTAVQALYRMRSARQRLAVRLPESAAFDTEPLRINGRVVPLECGDKKDHSIPLVGQTPDKPFLVELRYTVDGGEARLDFPDFPEDPAVQEIYLCVYLPEELVLLGYRGPWSRDPARSGAPSPTAETSSRSAEELVSWVSEGVQQADTPPFPTDGRLYVFSTLRPPESRGGVGSLRLVAFFEKWVHALVFGAILLVGLLLLRRSLSERLIAAGLVFAVLVLTGVFLPTFSESMINRVLFCAVYLVLALWLIESAVLAVSRRAAARASTAATTEHHEELVAAPVGPPPELSKEQDAGQSESRVKDQPDKEGVEGKDAPGDDAPSEGGRSDA